jgi:hypothetical protein
MAVPARPATAASAAAATARNAARRGNEWAMSFVFMDVSEAFSSAQDVSNRRLSFAFQPPASMLGTNP